VVVSRGNKELLNGYLGQKCPEMESGAVEIKNIAREAGVRQ